MAFRPKQAWNRMGRVNGSDAAKMARKVYVCEGCDLWHYDTKPPQCLSCGRMDFYRFDSIGEAKRWAKLQLLQRAGLISDLRRQVPFPLMTVGREGLTVKWAEYVADFVYLEDGVRVIGDHKPSAGMSPDAALKLRCMAAMGTPVTVFTDKGEV